MCKRCVMRVEDDPDLTLIDGICNHCHRYDKLLESRIASPEEAQSLLKAQVATIKASTSSSGYDCLIGLSGGVDSTYVALLVKDLGLRPLAFHVDNGWNTPLAEGNIQKTIDHLELDVEHVRLAPEVVLDLQRAFLYASTPDADVPSDHAIQASMWGLARKHGIKYVISGMNFRTESIDVPSWSYGHSDWHYIRGVHRRFGRGSLGAYPHFSLMRLMLDNALRGLRIVSLLNYVPYERERVQRELETRLDWTPYENKHFENVFTRVFQGFILPVKFGIDKRRAHLSDLINSGQIERGEALAVLARPPYDEETMQGDIELLKEKLELSDVEFDRIMNAEPRSYRDFANRHWVVQMLRQSVNLARKLGWYPK